MKIKNKIKNAGFTLVEILVVISIIAVLSTIGITSFRGIQERAKDSVRKNDLNTLATALEVYAQSNNGSYISGVSSCQTDANPANNTFYNAIKNYLSNPNKIPKDPATGQAYCYISTDGTSYRLFTKLSDCTDSALCPYTNYNYSITSDNLTIANAPNDTLINPPPTPTCPTVIASIGTNNNPKSVAVSGNYAYVVNQTSLTLQKFDVSTSTLSQTGYASTHLGTNAVAVSGNYAYVVNSSANTLQKFDISGATPVLLDYAFTESYPVAIAISGNFAYVVNKNYASLQKFDISTNTPILVSSTATGSNPFSIAISGNYAYVVNRNANTLQKFDITANPPSLVSNLTVGTTPEFVFVSGNFAYVISSGTNTLQKIDVSTNNPFLVSSITITSPSTGYPPSVFVSGNYAYVTSGNFQKFDISTSPMSLICSVSTGGTPASVYVSGNNVYTVDSYNSLKKFSE